MSVVGRMQFVGKKTALKRVQGKPCAICGAPSSCAVRDNGVAPACLDHGLMAQGLGYMVEFPDNDAVSARKVSVDVKQVKSEKDCQNYNHTNKGD